MLEKPGLAAELGSALIEGIDRLEFAHRFRNSEEVELSYETHFPLNGIEYELIVRRRKT